LVRVNGRELPSGGRGEVVDAATKEATVTVRLEEAVKQPDGENVVEVRASDGQGLILSRGVKVPWKTTRTDSPTQLYAIVAGNFWRREHLRRQQRRICSEPLKKSRAEQNQATYLPFTWRVMA